MIQCNQLLVGLPGTGKTTFLAALYHVVESADIEDSLVLEKLDFDTEYLNTIREQWLKCETIERTTGSKKQVGRMVLRVPDSSFRAEVVIPDLLGETFDRQFEERRWTKDFSNLVASCNGLIVFIHPDKVVPVRSIMEANYVLGPGADDGSDVTAPQWNLKDAATQIKMVDILQFILNEIPEGRLLPIAIVISAWDRVLDVMRALGEPSPSEWLGKYLPLLNQFLVSNFERLNYEIFGISAQGGDYEKDSKKLQGEASRRVLVVTKTGNNRNDISSPIRWIMSIVGSQTS